MIYLIAKLWGNIKWMSPGMDGAQLILMKKCSNAARVTPLIMKGPLDAERRFFVYY